MEHLIKLYQNNVIVSLICDGIALLVSAVTLIFMIMVFTVACAV